MKHNKILFASVCFFSGLLAGITVLGLMSFSPAPGTGVVPLNQTAARSYIAGFVAGAAPSNTIIKGFTIDKSQLEAMNLLNRENQALSGFRIYLGKNESGKLLGIVVGIDSQGKDAVNNSIFGTDAKSVSPCPPACDAAGGLANP